MACTLVGMGAGAWLGASVRDDDVDAVGETVSGRDAAGLLALLDGLVLGLATHVGFVLWDGSGFEMVGSRVVPSVFVRGVRLGLWDGLAEARDRSGPLGEVVVGGESPAGCVMMAMEGEAVGELGAVGEGVRRAACPVGAVVSTALGRFVGAVEGLLLLLLLRRVAVAVGGCVGNADGLCVGAALRSSLGGDVSKSFRLVAPGH